MNSPTLHNAPKYSRHRSSSIHRWRKRSCHCKPIHPLSHGYTNSPDTSERPCRRSSDPHCTALCSDARWECTRHTPENTSRQTHKSRHRTSSTHRNALLSTDHRTDTVPWKARRCRDCTFDWRNGRRDRRLRECRTSRVCIAPRCSKHLSLWRHCFRVLGSREWSSLLDEERVSSKQYQYRYKY